MDNLIDVDIQVDETALQAKLQKLIEDDSVKVQANQILARIIDPWIPYDTGELAGNITITADGITYHAPYAAKNYYGDDIRHKTDKHPLATAHWDDVAMQTEMPKLIAEIRDVLIRKANEQNG